LWAHAALASPGTPPAPVQLCAKPGGAVVYAASGTCPGNTTAIAPVAQQSGVADLFTRLNTDEATISSLQSQLTTANTAIGTLQNQVTTANTAIGSLQSQATTANNNIASLQSLLKGVSRAPDANGYDTLIFSGVNLQVVNGTGSESTTNGLGNLIVGYEDNISSYARTGSHNLVTGTNGGWTSYGGLLAGNSNQVTARYASVSGGANNTASGQVASVSGGILNRASGGSSSVSGGLNNNASGVWASVSGGESNNAGGSYNAILGGSGTTIGADINCGYFPDSPTTSHC
jgi:prefoldin subunit 5